MPEFFLVREGGDIKPGQLSHFLKFSAKGFTHSIDHLFWNGAKNSFTHIDSAAYDRSKRNLPFAFLLSANHNLNDRTKFVGFLGSKAIHYSKLLATDFSPIEVTNPFPSFLVPLRSNRRGGSADLYEIKCLEEEDRFEIEVAVRDFKGNISKELTISADCQHPSISSHTIILAMANVEPLTFQVPWPVLVDDIQSKKIKGKQNRICVILKKSLNDPWPVEFRGRSKFDVDRLKLWKDLASNGNLTMHLNAQFTCFYFPYEKCFKESFSPTPNSSMPLFTVGEYLESDIPKFQVFVSPLLKTREIIKAIFNSYQENSYLLFAIYDQLYEKDPAPKSKNKKVNNSSAFPIFHLRVRPPIRFSPDGSPLLLVSVIDHQLAQKLVDKGKLDPEENQADFHRIITEGVSREMCTVYAASSEEVNLLRFSLRFNSTRMRRGAWQSKNLPRSENSPWMATFLSPLYLERIYLRDYLRNDCKCDSAFPVGNAMEK